MKRIGILMAGLLAALAALPDARAQKTETRTETVPSPSELKKLSIEELMDLDVTSVSRRSEKLSRAAAAITVITQEDLRRSGVTSLPEALRLAVSLHVARFDGRTWAISARGFNLTTANKMLVLIDGRSVYTPLFSGVFWDVQDTVLEDVDRIEVIRGPGATLWGANAVNGVINVITRNAAETQGGLAAAGAGNEEHGFATARYGGALGETGHYRVYARYYDRDGLARQNGDDAGDGARMGQSGFRADWTGAATDSFTVQGDVYDGRLGHIVQDDTRVDGGNLLGRWSRRFSATSSADLQVYWDRTHRDIPAQFEEHLDTWDLDFQHRLQPAPGHDLTWGLGYRYSRDRVDNSPLVAFLPEHRGLDLASGFIQDEIAFAADRLHLTVGTKLEHNESTGFEVQPSARFFWTPKEDRTLWAALSRAVRTPTRIDEDVRFFAPNGLVTVQGSRDFESEELLAWELGYRVLPWQDLSLDVAAFYNVYDHLRTVEPQPGGGFPWVIDNRMDAETWGVEVRAAWQVSERWRLYGGYAFLDEDFQLDPDSHDVNRGQGEGNDPWHRFSLRSLLDLPGGVELDAWLRRTSELPAPTVPDYTELDLRLGWHATEALELSLVGQNLLHDQHLEFRSASSIPEEVERSVYGKVTWRF